MHSGQSLVSGGNAPRPRWTPSTPSTGSSSKGQYLICALVVSRIIEGLGSRSGDFRSKGSRKYGRIRVFRSDPDFYSFFSSPIRIIGLWGCMLKCFFRCGHNSGYLVNSNWEICFDRSVAVTSIDKTCSVREYRNFRTKKEKRNQTCYHSLGFLHLPFLPEVDLLL